MIVLDQMYGLIAIPDWLSPVVLSPEVQRLREIRLINTSSPTCAALSDARRFTHTLGVLFLSMRLCARVGIAWSERERRAFLVAAMLHDIGTPPFGHLFEYLLAAYTNWNHETFVSDIIRGSYRPEKKYHQIYYSNSLSLRKTLSELNIDSDLILSFIRGEGLPGKYLAGSLDLDNIDNVYRMGLLLGLHPDTTSPVCLVDSLLPNALGPAFPEHTVPSIEQWQKLRRKSYTFLAFDDSCVSSQAMLTDCLTKGLEGNELGPEHWFITDEELIRRLWRYAPTKDIIRRFAIGDFYNTVFLGWYHSTTGEKDFRHPIHRRALAEALLENTGIPCSPYVFYDNGTFSKQLTLNIEGRDKQIKVVGLGEKSQSTIIGVFTPHRICDSDRRKYCDRIVRVLEENGFPASGLAPIPRKEDNCEIYRQTKLPI